MAAVARCKVLLQLVLRQPRKQALVLVAMFVSHSSVAAAGDEKLAAMLEELHARYTCMALCHLR